MYYQDLLRWRNKYSVNKKKISYFLM